MKPVAIATQPLLTLAAVALAVMLGTAGLVAPTMPGVQRGEAQPADAEGCQALPAAAEGARRCVRGQLVLTRKPPSLRLGHACPTGVAPCVATRRAGETAARNGHGGPLRC